MTFADLISQVPIPVSNVIDKIRKCPNRILTKRISNYDNNNQSILRVLINEWQQKRWQMKFYAPRCKCHNEFIKDKKRNKYLKKFKCNRSKKERIYHEDNKFILILNELLNRVAIDGNPLDGIDILIPACSFRTYGHPLTIVRYWRNNMPITGMFEESYRRILDLYRKSEKYSLNFSKILFKCLSMIKELNVRELKNIVYGYCYVRSNDF